MVISNRFGPLAVSTDVLAPSFKENRVMGRLKSLFFAGLVFSEIALLSCAAEKNNQGEKAKAPDVQIRSDPSVELVSIIFHLAGNEEYNRTIVESYAKDIEEHFGKYRDHEAIRLARQLYGERSVSYDAPMSLAVHLAGGADLKERIPLDPLPEVVDSRWTAEDAKAFVAAARQFAIDTKFDDFWKAHDALYADMRKQLQTLIDKEAHLEWFTEFFGERPRTAFILIPNITNGPCNYGSRFRGADGKEEIYCILGVWKLDLNKQPALDSGVLPTITHEFCHSHTNPLVDRHAAELQAAGEKIFKYVGPTMARNAYGKWQTMMRESMVRACTIEYLMKYQGKMAAGLNAVEDRNIGFEWIGELSKLLADKYERDRERYPTLDAFMPEVVAFFDKYAEDFERKQEELAGKRPKVVSMTPENGSEDVDPETKELRIVFDRPMMDGSWSIVGGGPQFPELVGKPSYDKARKVLAVGVKLKRGATYHFMLNSDRFHSFQSDDGVPLEPIDVEFATRK
jgi:hypothetical protein